MASITFDTLKFARKLEKNGFSTDQATILVELQKESIAESMDTQLATKTDISEVKLEINRLDKELAVVKWVSFATFAIVAIPFIKGLFS